MSNHENITDFDEMVLVGDLRVVQAVEKVREQRRQLKWHFAHASELHPEELEEPEED